MTFYVNGIKSERMDLSNAIFFTASLALIAFLIGVIVYDTPIAMERETLRQRTHASHSTGYAEYQWFVKKNNKYTKGE